MSESHGHSHHRFVIAPTGETLRGLALPASLALAAATLLYWVDRLFTLAH